jgi:hypothetical protein
MLSSVKYPKEVMLTNSRSVFQSGRYKSKAKKQMKGGDVEEDGEIEED